MYYCVSFYLECILMDVILSPRQLWRPCTYQSDKCLAVRVPCHIHEENFDLSFPWTVQSHYLSGLSWIATHIILFSPSILQLHKTVMVILTIKNHQSKLWSVALGARLLPDACEVKVRQPTERACCLARGSQWLHCH